MKASELRIGNYVWQDYEGVYLVRGVPDDKNATVSKGTTTIAVSFTLNSESNPIPITEDWLFKLGGFNWANEIRMPIPIVKFLKHPNEQGDIVCFAHNCSHGHIKYVHQLQNLYFALTGEELTLKQ